MADTSTSRPVPATKQPPEAANGAKPSRPRAGRRTPGAIDLADPSLYFNRELSLLGFQERVLEEAEEPGLPLLERAKFLAIVGSNLDEFFMVRVAGLQEQLADHAVELPPDGAAPADQLARVRKEALRLMQRAQRCWRDEVQPGLSRQGVRILDYGALGSEQRERVAATFDETIFPVLTPLGYDVGRPFPHISNLSLNLAVLVREPSGDQRFARVKVPDSLPRLLPLKRSSGGVRMDGTVPHDHQFVWLEQVIAAHLPRLFPGLEVLEAHPFHVTRDADLEIQELEAGDLLQSIEVGVRQRRFGHVVRLMVQPEMPEAMRDFLTSELELRHLDVYVLDGPLGLSSLMALMAVERHDLKVPPFAPAMPPALDPRTRGGTIFDAIRQRDILLHHPFESFDPVIEFLEAAARDPDVLAIKQTLYRVGKNSPVVRALLEAIQRGKQVAVLVELKARFDEESNIEWARKLESEGVHVVYGLRGLKTHSKIALVVRKEGGGIRRYVHLATGNYNAVTAQLYTDVGLFTADEAIGADATDIFNYLTGYSLKGGYRTLIVAPIGLRARMEALIRREMDHARAGRPARLVFKMNALIDAPMIRRLYEASRAGVRVDLIVRGTCGLRPGVPGVSKRIRVISVVGRFLEHSRIYYFHNGGDDEVYLSSADLMPRNIDRRVEILFPVADREIIDHLRDVVLETYLADTVNARELGSDGEYRAVRPVDGAEPVDSQARLLAWYLGDRAGG